MPKFLYFLVLLMILGSCKERVSEAATGEVSNFEAMANELPKVVPVNTKARVILDTWKEFYSFDKSFERIYTIDYREDLVLVIDDLVEKQKLLEKAVYPEEFDIPQIKGRQKVVKTYILKTKGDLEYRQDPENSIKEMITAYNALREQFNVTVNNTLPTELIENEDT
ncbi:hypothetical protein PP182_03215 [Maribacter sp. PR1]|uniref:Uncharacterized protein n=1 Tax=Maribacter cobaltidurans TaxID=1178778 RepID=A0ABU7IQ26_9FLAO|nr:MULTISPECIES: hypothetical protein [Maribacter]MDC6387675.1 hypothetical protein [Maribacter sp. PR1]MEE1975064.1 hypothetical protein [Maribacter cobaltidurans]